jgi:hypothetical protein
MSIFPRAFFPANAKQKSLCLLVEIRILKDNLNIHALGWRLDRTRKNMNCPEPQVGGLFALADRLEQLAGAGAQAGGSFDAVPPRPRLYRPTRLPKSQ